MYGFCRDPKNQKWRRSLALRGWPFGGQYNRREKDPEQASTIWTSATCRDRSRVSCMYGSRCYGHGL
jgi:hypothetical protein